MSLKFQICLMGTALVISFIYFLNYTIILAFTPFPWIKWSCAKQDLAFFSSGLYKSYWRRSSGSRTSVQVYHNGWNYEIKNRVPNSNELWWSIGRWKFIQFKFDVIWGGSCLSRRFHRMYKSKEISWI